MPAKSKSQPPTALRVIVTVVGGVADVLLKPAGVEVCIFDYDVQSEDADRLERDPDGRLCCIARWASRQRVIGNKHWPIVRSAARQLRQESTTRWRCDRCHKTVTCHEADLAEAGTSYCAACDRPMEMI